MGVLTGELGKLVFGGRLAVDETWACSIHFCTGTIETLDDSILLPGYEAPLRDWFTRQYSYIAANATLDYIKFNQVNKSDGKYTASGESNTLVLAVPAVGGLGTKNTPPQLTQAVTWHTDVDRGRASKGRIYPPGNIFLADGAAMGSDGLTNQGFTGLMADSYQELLSELNAVSAEATACVWSQVGQTARAIERVSVGRVIDTQKRRRKNLGEERVFATAAV